MEPTNNKDSVPAGQDPATPTEELGQGDGQSCVPFTPGPWLVPDHNFEVVSSGEGRIIADTYSLHRPDLCYRKPVREANARLIAASPVLYEALTKIAAWDDEGGNRELYERRSYSGFDEPGSVRLAREALAAVVHNQNEEGNK